MRSTARLTKEFSAIQEAPLDRCEVALQGEEVGKWDVKIQGPEDSPYESGTFLLEMDFTDNYPFKAPKVVFKTKIWHPNVQTETGEICTQAIEKSWVPTQNAKYVIEQVISLLADPRPEDALEAEIAEQFSNDFEGFKEKVQKYIAEFAS
jgi:ubiquitin-conjugating enzyme E2 D/E